MIACRSPLLASICVLALGSLCANAQASAGIYQVTSCNAAPEAVNNSWTWSTSDTSTPSHYAEFVSCPYRSGGVGGTTDQQGGLSTTDALGLASGAAPGMSAGWTFAAPAGTTITAITYERYLGYKLDTPPEWSAALRADGTVMTGEGESCVDTSGSCIVGAPPGEGAEPGFISGLSAHELSLSIVCEAPSGEECVTGATEHKVWAAMYGATVTLTDRTPPTLGTPTGALWEAGVYGGYHKGIESVTVEAQDVGGGVQGIVLSADGTPMETYTAKCNFTYAQPCLSSTGPQTLTLPTTELTDGTHTLTLAAIDAAGNESTLASKQISVDNSPPSAPLDLVATPTQPGSSTFTATWADPPGQVAPITEATYKLCPVSGSGSCGATTPAPAAGPASIAVPGPGVWTLAVWLTNVAGNSDPGNAASVTLTVPEPESHGEGGSQSSQGGGGSGQTGGKPGQGGSTSDGGGPPGQGGKSGKGTASSKAKLHLSARLTGRMLIVLLRCRGGGRVRLRYSARYHGHQIGWRSETVTLRNGQRTVRFELRAKVAMRATIRVSAKVPGGGAVVTSRSHRRRHLARPRAAGRPTQAVERTFPGWPGSSHGDGHRPLSLVLTCPLGRTCRMSTVRVAGS
ncbi:MAG: hypothetical protein ACYCXW_01150 [Solirubrobacteraceae bacterium]